MTKKPPGKIVIISSPSGGGKSSICRELLTPIRKRSGWSFSVSYTTRKKRNTERNGREYVFVDHEEFDFLVARRFFAEHFQVHGNKYGTPREPLQKVVREGGVKILDIDIQGARKIKKGFPRAVTIFVLPPSIAELRKRLKRRGTETREELEIRFQYESQHEVPW